MDEQWMKQWNQGDRPPIHGVLRPDEYERMKPLPEGSGVAVIPEPLSVEEWQDQHGTTDPAAER